MVLFCWLEKPGRGCGLGAIGDILFFLGDGELVGHDNYRETRWIDSGDTVLSVSLVSGRRSGLGPDEA